MWLKADIWDFIHEIAEKVKFRENLENYAEIRCICLNVYLKFGFSILKRTL